MPGILTEETVATAPDISVIVPHAREENDRPGWIPSDITRDWDTNPYAYQTEEELMPAGGLHGDLLTRFAEVVRAFLETRGIRFLADTFMLYRDERGVKQRISPDFLIMPFRSPPPSAYDLDVEPPPLAVVEITSSKSHMTDRGKKLRLYMGMGIPVYLVIDAITPGGKQRDPIRLTLWRKEKGRIREIPPDADGYLAVPEMHVKMKAEGRNLVVVDIKTGEILRDTGELIESELWERQRAEREKKRADRERQRAERLAAKLREMGISPE